jgi:hypothetical protein
MPTGQELVAWCAARLGVPYSWDGRFGPYRFDCSGYMTACLWDHGIQPTGTNSTGLENWCRNEGGGLLVPYAEHIAGALVFIWGYGANGHVGMSMGDGRVIETPSDSNGGATGISPFWQGRTHNGWTGAALIPGVDYNLAPKDPVLGPGSFGYTLGDWQMFLGVYPVSGQWDQQTAEKVSAFQSLMLIPVTGVIDQQTWDTRRFIEAIPPAAPRPMPPEAPGEGCDISEHQEDDIPGPEWFDQWAFVIIRAASERGRKDKSFDKFWEWSRGRTLRGVYGWPVAGGDNGALGAQLVAMAPDAEAGYWADYEITPGVALPSVGELETYLHGVGDHLRGFYSNSGVCPHTPFLDSLYYWHSDYGPNNGVRHDPNEQPPNAPRDWLIHQYTSKPIDRNWCQNMNWAAPSPVTPMPKEGEMWLYHNITNDTWTLWDGFNWTEQPDNVMDLVANNSIPRSDITEAALHSLRVYVGKSVDALVARIAKAVKAP